MAKRRTPTASSAWVRAMVGLWQVGGATAVCALGWHIATEPSPFRAMGHLANPTLADLRATLVAYLPLAAWLAVAVVATYYGSGGLAMLLGRWEQQRLPSLPDVIEPTPEPMWTTALANALGGATAMLFAAAAVACVVANPFAARSTWPWMLVLAAAWTTAIVRVLAASLGLASRLAAHRVRLEDASRRARRTANARKAHAEIHLPHSRTRDVTIGATSVTVVSDHTTQQLPLAHADVALALARRDGARVTRDPLR